MSFDTIKIALTNSPILILPDLNEPFLLFTYALKHSLLGVLTQERTTNINDLDIKVILAHYICQQDISRL